MIRVVADTNVYISGFVFGGRISEVLELAQEGKIVLFVSEPILNELEAVLRRKFQWPEEQRRRALGNVLQFTHLILPEISLSAVPEDPADNRILECAVEAEADVLVTGDRHLLKLKRFGGIQIVSPALFLDSKAWEQ